MISTNISFDKAIETVEHFTTPFKKGKHKGKTRLEISEVGFTCYANAIKVLTAYRDLGKVSVPSKSEKAAEILNKIKEV